MNGSSQNSGGSRPLGAPIPKIEGMDPTAGSFRPNGTSKFAKQGQWYNGPSQKPDSPKYEAASPAVLQSLLNRVHELEEAQKGLQKDVSELKTANVSLTESVNYLKKGSWSVEVGPFQETRKLGQTRNEVKVEASKPVVQSPKTLVQSQKAAEKTPKTAEKAPKTAEKTPKTAEKTSNDKTMEATNPPVNEKPAPPSSARIPPHKRRPAATVVEVSVYGRTAKPKNLQTNESSIPKDKDSANRQATKAKQEPPQETSNPLVTDGKVDYSPVNTPLTPPYEVPTSPTTTFAPDAPRQSIEDPYVVQSSLGWFPSTLSSFPNLSPEELSQIPPATKMQTFHPDFLRNFLGGIIWSPGLNYIKPTPGSGSCILKNRTYYTLDAKFEPYLPREPGRHGAKLTAFFNDNPQDENVDQEIFDNVPLFVCCTPWAMGTDKERYVYFGNYSQTRWSDKLDYDRMVACVPASVKEFWAEELSAVGRDEWVTKALMEHFYPKPEYDGRLFEHETGGVDDKEDEKVMRDLRKYARELKAWEKDARLKTSLIKKDFILQAFERADADEPPALRLWWEYLKCDRWDRGFYDFLVKLQSREKHYL